MPFTIPCNIYVIMKALNPYAPPHSTVPLPYPPESFKMHPQFTKFFLKLSFVTLHKYVCILLEMHLKFVEVKSPEAEFLGVTGTKA